MIRIPPDILARITRLAEAAYPDECCGLFGGHTTASGDTVVTGLFESRNLAEGSHRDSFEVDPLVRFQAMRALDGGPDSIIGHYHSHPDHPAQPSARDAAQAYEPDLIWVILSVRDGKAVDVTAHRYAPDRSQFDEIPIDQGDSPEPSR